MFVNRNPIRLWVTRAEAGERARVWRCGHCGAKIFCGRLTDKPSYLCLCGEASWKAMTHISPQAR